MSLEKNNTLLEQNKLLKLQRFYLENLFENKEQFRSATGIYPDCFMRLFNYLIPGDNPGYFQAFVRGKVNKFRGS